MSLSASRSRAATSFQRLSAVSSIVLLHACCTLLRWASGCASIAACGAVSMRFPGLSARPIGGICRGFPAPHDSPQLWTTCRSRAGSRFPRLFPRAQTVDNGCPEWSGYTRPRPVDCGPPLFTGLMKRTYQPNVRKRKRKHGFRDRMSTRAGRLSSSGVAPRAASASRRRSLMQRRNRLSRSRDFDAVYRQGRSASTRFLTLYWFQRDETVGEPRLGFAVPKAVGSAPGAEPHQAPTARDRTRGVSSEMPADQRLRGRGATGVAGGGRDKRVSSGSRAASTSCSRRRRSEGPTPPRP